jgi:hypothetical protein
MEISLSQILEQTEEFKNNKKAWHKIVDPWFNLVDTSNLSDSDKKKTKDELSILARFVIKFSEPLEIIEGIRECPDFIVLLGKKRIGIELSQIILDSKDKQKRGTIEKVFNRVEKVLNTDNSNSGRNGIYEVRFNPIEITGKNSSKIVEELKLIFDNKLTTTPKFIKSIRMTCPHDSVVFSHSEGWVVGQFDQESLDKAIEKKEVKLKKYEVGTTQEQWLLLFTSGIGESGDFSFINNETLTKKYESSFSRIFLYEFSSRDIHEFNVNPPI